MWKVALLIGQIVLAGLKAIPIVNKWISKTRREKLEAEKEEIEKDIESEQEDMRPGKGP